MNPHRQLSIVQVLIFILAYTFSVAIAGTPEGDSKTKQILDATGVKGGGIVHVGCGDGKLTTSLRTSYRYLVQGLDTDKKNIRKARDYIQSQGIYGVVSVDWFDGQRLPYVDNLVNLIVSEDDGSVQMAEIMRVLCPHGIAYVKQNGKWTKIQNPRPEDIDEWTHYLYDAGGNAVSRDKVVGPPRRFQWMGSPRWSRHHDRRSSISAMVSSGGRIFHIFDEGSVASIMQQPKQTCRFPLHYPNGICPKPRSRCMAQRGSET